MTSSRIGIIGGSGLYRLLDPAISESRRVDTPYGPAAVVLGLLFLLGVPGAVWAAPARTPVIVFYAAETTAQAAEYAIDACKSLGIDALGHRVVHGGPRFREPARISPEMVSAVV